MTKIDHIVLAVHDLEAAADLYARLGFTLAPKASHPWGTDNVCIQLADETYIEHLAMARLDEVPEPAGDVFSFGAFNRDFLTRREGFSMLAIEGNGPEDDRDRFAGQGLIVHSPSGMERDQRLPDGSVVRMAFRTQFATDLNLDGEATVFGCYKSPKEAFWNPHYQKHANGISGLDHVCIVTPSVEAADKLVSAAGLPDNDIRIEIDPSVCGARFRGYVMRADDPVDFCANAKALGIATEKKDDVMWLDPARTFGVRVGVRKV